MNQVSNRAAPGVQAQRTPQRGMKWMLLSMLLAVLASATLSVWAQPAPGGPGGPGGPGMGGPGGGPGMMSGRRIDHMLDGLNATEAQRTQIKQIMQAAATDMKAQREAGRALHERAAQIFAAPTVDAAAAESVRQQMVQQHDQGSRRMLQAMLDAAKVLSPEQRAKLAERMKQRGDMMRERMQRMERDGPRR
jgi:Spy/CpxP family protein refolding chaperone